MTRREAPLTAVFQLTTSFESFLSNLYDELAAELKDLGADCQACGRCCLFGEFDHELWLTEPELAFLFSKDGLKDLEDNAACPYQKDGHCVARSGRPLGCRVFHCNVPAQILEDLSAKYLDRIKLMAKETGFECGYGEFMASLRLISK